MRISLCRTGGVYEVRVASGGLYTVDVSIPACTCPDWQAHQPAGGCGHLRRVSMEIEARTVPGPDGQLSSAETPEPEGRSGASSGPLITGPHIEYDQYGNTTGSVFYRCSQCGQEALRRDDIHGGPSTLSSRCR
jgi:hypothetical protein